MSPKENLKAKICITSLEPNFPLGEFVEWASVLDDRQVLQLLNEIQLELNAQERRSRENISEPYHVMHSYWCFYCEQVRSYYRAIIRSPHQQAKLSFLL